MKNTIEFIWKGLFLLKYEYLHQWKNIKIKSFQMIDSTVAHKDLRILSPSYNYKWRQPHVYKYDVCDSKVTWAARGWQEGWKENQMCFNLGQCKDLHWFKRGG